MNRAELANAQSNRLFEQIYDYLLERIKRGEWKEHEKLPSVRKLASEFKVHRLTVYKAYQLLKENGKVYVKEKSGYYVQPDTMLSIGSLECPIISSYVQESHLSEIHQVEATYQFSKALLDPKLLPNLYLSEYAKKIFDLYPKILGTYSTVQGDEELREALSHYLNKKYQFYLTADEMMITTGSQFAIDLLAKVFIKPRDVVLMERPTYSPAIDVFRRQGAQIISTELQPDGFDLEQVEALMQTYKPRLFYLNPTFHNPTGYTIPTEQRKQLVDLAERYQCLIIEDDPYRDIYFHHEPPPKPLFSYDTVGCVIYIRSFSKYVAPGLGVAIVACRPALMRLLLKAKSLSDSGTPLISQKIFLHYFFSERMQQHLEKLRTALAIRKEVMEEELSRTDWQWTSPMGGFNFWLRLPGKISMEKLLSESIEHSLTFVPGSICDPHRELKEWIRLSYSFLNEQQLRNGLRQLVSLYQSLSEAN